MLVQRRQIGVNMAEQLSMKREFISPEGGRGIYHSGVALQEFGAGKQMPGVWILIPLIFQEILSHTDLRTRCELGQP